MWNKAWNNECFSATPTKSYGSCLCAYQMTDIDSAFSEFFSESAECSTSGFNEYVTQLCSWAGVDLSKAEAEGGSGSATTAAGDETKLLMVIIRKRDSEATPKDYKAKIRARCGVGQILPTQARGVSRAKQDGVV